MIADSPAEVEFEVKDTDTSAWTEAGWAFSQSTFQYCELKSSVNTSCNGIAPTTVAHFPARVKVMVRVPTCGPEFKGLPH